MTTTFNYRAVEPTDAVAFWNGGWWSDQEMREWIMVRSPSDEAHANRLMDAMRRMRGDSAASPRNQQEER